MSRWPVFRLLLLTISMACLLACATTTRAQSTETIGIRGHDQCLRLYGTRGAFPIIVSSGDGGWIHLGPHVAEVLAARGFFVVGFDVRAYLSGFTTRSSVLRPEDAPDDFRALIDFAARGSSERPLLVGVSEGAGLSVLAATAPRTRDAISGIVALGLPEVNELGWRWRDALIYVTHGAPNEPSFSATSVVSRIGRTPLAAIHSTRDEFAPLADVRRILDVAHEPKRLWTVDASNHRFSGNEQEFDRRLLDAIAWVRANAVPRAPRD
jgi:hypothetical protein